MKVKVTVKKPEKTNSDTAIVSLYAYWFDETCAAWTKDAESNKFFLINQQAYANEKLKANGYLFLNDVLDMLGIPRTKVGQVVGWIYDKDNTSGDNFVDFGLYAPHNTNFVNGYEKSVLLNFNVDGDILDKI